jgi:hypothetical protein
MTSIFPNAIDGFEQLPLVVDGITPVNAFSVNTLRSAILNIERELGVDPSGTYDTVVERLDAIEASQGADLTDIENRVTILEDQVSQLITELGTNPSGSFPTVEDRLDFLEAATTAPLTLTTDDPLFIGSLVTINTSGNVELADANTGLVNDARVIGPSLNNYLIGASAEIGAVPGKLVSVLFSAAPLAASNGEPVFLSDTPGFGTLTPPTASGTVIFLVGILQGADGITTTPSVVFQPKIEALNG